MLRIGDDFQLGNGTEEKRAFHCPRFNLLRSIEGKRFGNHSSERVHAIEEEQGRSEQTDLNGNGQVEDHRQEERDQQRCLIRHGELSEANKFMPIAHVKGHEQKDGRKRTQRDVHCQGSSYQDNDQKGQTVDHAGHRSDGPALDVGDGTSNGAG